MESLPPELFDNVFRYLPKARDLLVLRAVNRFFRARFTPPAFRVVKFSDDESNATRLIALASSSLATHIIELHLDVELIPWVAANEAYYAPRSPRAALANAFIHLRSLYIYFANEKFTCENRLRVQNNVLLGFIGSIIRPTSLTFMNFLPNTNICTNHPNFPHFMNRLTHLSLDHYTIGLEIRHWLQCVEGTLESLVLKSNFWIEGPFDEEAGGWLHEFPTDLNLTTLKKLELSKYIFSSSNMSIESLIVSEPVSSTLQELVLSGCVAICAEPIHQECHNWEGIFRLFQQRLKRLKEFRIGEPLGYMTGIRGQYDCGRYDRNLAIRLADINAVNALWEGIGQETRIENAEKHFWCSRFFSFFSLLDINIFAIPAHGTPLGLTPLEKAMMGLVAQDSSGSF